MLASIEGDRICSSSGGGGRTWKFIGRFFRVPSFRGLWAHRPTFFRCEGPGKRLFVVEPALTKGVTKMDSLKGKKVVGVVWGWAPI